VPAVQPLPWWSEAQSKHGNLLLDHRTNPPRIWRLLSDPLARGLKLARWLLDFHARMRAIQRRRDFIKRAIRQKNGADKLYTLYIEHAL